MKHRIRVAPAAAAQIRSAAKWWYANRDKAPDAFTDELEAAYRVISEVPNAGEAVSHPTIDGLRRVFLGRVRYHLYYVMDGDVGTIEVLALWHSSRGASPL